ncbi:MAG TPA: hypothetical protein PLM62_00820, partial [Zoogloea sp.]|nr:hypothetical protein [Zoogloea sp.]
MLHRHINDGRYNNISQKSGYRVPSTCPPGLPTASLQPGRSVERAPAPGPPGPMTPAPFGPITGYLPNVNPHLQDLHPYPFEKLRTL